jgi:EAL domain-containing protein (putative c-di-GMP-specific phosphodiesterase class I)
MTTTSDSGGSYIDFAAFGLGPEGLRSLQALEHLWGEAVDQAAEGMPASQALADFVTLTRVLPTRLDNLDWQQRWMRAWHKAGRAGFALSEMYRFFCVAVEYAGTMLSGERGAVTRVHIDLQALLRRGVGAAVAAAMELDEETRRARSGPPGEAAACRVLGEMAAAGRPMAVLSLTMTNRNAFAHLAASDVHSLPGLLAEKLGALLRPQDSVFAGRDGEWLVLLADVRSQAQPALAAAHIQRAFAEPVGLLGGRNVLMNVLIGAAMMPDHGADADAVIQAARLARWDLPATHRSFGWFHDGLDRDWQARDQMTEELRRALRSQQGLDLHLQPQVDATTGECVGAEALLRWKRDNGQWVPPPLVMELVDENGWRSTFTDWLLRTSLRIAADLDAAGMPIGVSINLTAFDLLDPDLPEMLRQRLDTWRVAPQRITIELTESVMMNDPKRSLEVMRKLSDYGLRLALDDFGTGYSSLSYLASLPLDELKIDRSFIVAMFDSVDSQRIVRTIIALARDLGMTPLAEGVEEAAQRDELGTLGCHLIQGYLYAKPMPLERFIEWFRERGA